MDKLNLCQLKEIIKQNKKIIKIYSNLNKNITVNVITSNINLEDNKKNIKLALRLLNQKVKKNQEEHIISDNSDLYLDDIKLNDDSHENINYTSESEDNKELKTQHINNSRPIHSSRGLGDNRLMNRMMGEAKFREEIFTDTIVKPFIEKNKQIKNNLGAKINLF